MRGRCLIAGALPLHDAVLDVVDGLSGRGWTIDVNGWTVPPSDARGGRWFESRLASNRRWIRDAARVARRVHHDVACAASASDWFRTLEDTLATSRYDVALLLADLAPVGLARLAARSPVPTVLVSLVALTQELHHRRWLPMLRAMASTKVARGQLHPQLLRAVDADALQTVVFPSRSWRDAAVAEGIAGTRSLVIPYGVHVPPRVPTRAADLRSPIRLLWVGRLSPEKGLHLFLDALPTVRRHLDARLTIIAARGPAAYAGQVHKRLACADLQEGVDLLPAMPRAALLDAFTQHDLLLFHSIFDEPVAQVLLHAAAAGLPVIGPQSRRRDALLREGETAWCYPDPAPDQIAAAIVRAAAAGEERNRRARAFHAEVRAHHDLSETIDRYDELLQRLARRSIEVTDACLTVPC